MGMCTVGTRKQPQKSDGHGDPRKATKRQTQREMARSCEPGHAGTAGGARRCRRHKLLEATNPDRRPLPGIRRKKRSEVKMREIATWI